MPRSGDTARIRRVPEPEPHGPWMASQTLGVGILTIGVLMFLAVVTSQGGFITVALREALRAAFGFGAYVLPLVVASYGLALLGGARVERSYRALWSAAVLFTVGVAVAHLGWGPKEGWLPEEGVAPGGYLGAAVGFGLRRLFGPVGGYVVLAAGAFVALLALSGRPVGELAARGWERAGQTWEPLAERLAAAKVEKRRKEVVARQLRPAPKPKPVPKPRPVPATPKPEPAKQPEQLSLSEFLRAEPAKAKSYKLPPLTLLHRGDEETEEYLRDEVEENIRLLEETLASFDIPARVLHFERGPAITRYEVEPAKGIRVTKVANLADDLAMALAAVDVRVEAPIPGKSAIGIEVPNTRINFVPLRTVLESEAFAGQTSPLAFALGKDIAGHPMAGDLARMPHLLIGGATNSGKSVCLNCIIASILFRARPDEVKFILIDPKRVELTLYEDIPHLLAPILHEARDAAYVLRATIREMERRYRLFAPAGVKNVWEYNERAPRMGRQPLPFIIIVVDELADLMMQGQAEFERLICRLAQLARATGIHLVVATQRPSVNVITGTIKANISSRIAFAVSSQVDSRTILDCNGAERLIGSGDMLYLPLEAPKATRIQGAYITTSEVEGLVAYLREQGEPEYMIEPPPAEEEEEVEEDWAADEMMDAALQILHGRSHISVSLLQRKLRIGYNRAARLIEALEEKGIVGPADGSRPRQVLLSPDLSPRKDEDE